MREIDDLRMDLVKICEWTETWQMDLNLDKCKVLHIGNMNGRKSYMLDSVKLVNTRKKKT